MGKTLTESAIRSPRSMESFLSENPILRFILIPLQVSYGEMIGCDNEEVRHVVLLACKLSTFFKKCFIPGYNCFVVGIGEFCNECLLITRFVEITLSKYNLFVPFP